MTEKNVTLALLAELIGGDLQGDPQLIIRGLQDLHAAGAGDITFIARLRNSAEITDTQASAVIVPLSVKEADKPVIRVRDPYLAAAIIHNYFVRRPFVAAGIDTQARLGEDCRIPAEVSVGPMVVLGDRVSLGRRVTIGPGVVLGDDVEIDDDTTLHANVTIAAACRIGKRVIIHSGTVIGSDGFGYATDEHGRHIKRPHVGIVQIDDEVEIGANVCIDRATFGRTWIKKGVKIDNLVQVAHNVVVGEDSLLVAQAGIAGSASLGRQVVLGGQAGVNGHITIDDGVMAAAKTGIFSNPKKGAVVSGMPAMPHKQWLKASAVFARLPQMFKEFRELRHQVKELRRKLDN